MWTSVPWSEILTIIGKVSLVYWFMMLGLKALGRRAIGQLGPHEFILIAILAKIMADQIVTREVGLWGNIAGGLTLLFYVGLIERVPWLRNFLQGSPIVLLQRGEPQMEALKKSHLSVEDLNGAARTYGFADYHVFETVYLERDGKLTGILKPLYLKFPERL
jgi:uncharacterized membrane protein YcaP (DUF421 family)